MPKFLLSVLRPHGFDPSTDVSDEMKREIDAVNEAMASAGVRIFVGGLQPPDRAQMVRPDGQPETNAPATRAEYLDGLWVIEVPSMDEALSWGARAARACGARLEVRPFH